MWHIWPLFDRMKQKKRHKFDFKDHLRVSTIAVDVTLSLITQTRTSRSIQCLNTIVLSRRGRGVPTYILVELVVQTTEQISLPQRWYMRFPPLSEQNSGFIFSANIVVPVLLETHIHVLGFGCVAGIAKYQHTHIVLSKFQSLTFWIKFCFVTVILCWMAAVSRRQKYTKISDSVKWFIWHSVDEWNNYACLQQQTHIHTSMHV